MKPQLGREPALHASHRGSAASPERHAFVAGFSVNHYGNRTVVLFGVRFATEWVHF
jgi:hypothetical protein